MDFYLPYDNNIKWMPRGLTGDTLTLAQSLSEYMLDILNDVIWCQSVQMSESFVAYNDNEIAPKCHLLFFFVHREHWIAISNS